MEQAPRISTQSPELKSQDFEFLREQALTVLQNIAAKSWTDHNLHDPGITMLEAICYALTETGLRAGMEIRDLVSSSKYLTEPEFFTAAQVLPSAPIKPSDFRKILINHPLVGNAWVFPISSSPQGRYSVLLEFEDDNLNSNNLVITVTPPALTDDYTVELAFPHWNEQDIIPMQQDIQFISVAFDGSPGNEWNNIVGGTSFFTRASVTYQPVVGGPQVMLVWVVANIITEMDDSLVEAPLILQEVLDEISTIGDNSAADQTILKQLNRRVVSAFESMRIIRRYTSPYRNLCKDIVEFNAIRLQEISVSAILEVGRGVNIEELLAEIYYWIYRMISPAIFFESLEDQMQQLFSSDEVFNGPLTSSGFLSDSSLGEQQILQTLYTSDILRIIYQLRKADDTDVERREDVNRRKIIAVRNLSLSNYLENRPITTGAKDCLRLVDSKNHIPRLSVVKSRISVYRNGLEIAYDNDLVNDLLSDKLSKDVQAVISPVLDIPLPKGETYPVDDYYPIQNDLPLVYGVGESGLPGDSTQLRIAQARQLKGYLMFFEQMFAGSLAQIASFNTFFSADPDIKQTLFQQPIYQVTDISDILKSYNASTTSWSDFQSNKNNGYEQVLSNKVETREQFLKKRNTILDHLLAIQGEEMLSRSELLFRQSAQLPEGITLTLSQIIDYQNQQRLITFQELIYDKSDYYADLPWLNRDKGQAFGHLLWRNDHFLYILKTGDLYEWTIMDSLNNPLLKHVTASASKKDILEVVEQVLKLATNNGNYTIRLEGGTDRRIEIRSSATADPLAESVDIYASDPLAQNAINECENTILGYWIAHTLIPLECRLFHMLGVDIRERRQLMYNVDDYIEIFDEVDTDPFIEKRFRLWSESGYSGEVLLTSENNYPGPTHSAATADAEKAVQQMIELGIHTLNYTIENPAPNAFRLMLLLPDGSPLARSPIDYGTEDEAQVALKRARLHLYRYLSGEGFYLLENHLLFPPDVANEELIIQELVDPYSFQLTIILPSGYSRDFSITDSVPQAIQPSLYRNGEFRKYAEKQIREHCPADILPRILWVDRNLPGTPIGALNPSFNVFEQAYLDWLRNYMTDEVDESVLGPSRDNLTLVVNALYQEYYSD